MENLKKYWVIALVVFGFFMFYKPIICFILLGATITIMGINYWIFLIKIQKKGIKGIGKILFYKSDSDGHKTPTVEFITRNGKQVKREPYFYSSTDLSIIKNYKNKINKAVTVIYDSKNPEKFVIESERKFNYFSLIFMSAIGILFFTIGILDVLEIINIDF